MHKIAFTAILGLGLVGFAAGASADKEKKLEKGKPLPPGIAKKLDQLPSGPGKKFAGLGPSVPEPSAALLFGIGSLVTAVSLRRQRR